MFTAGLGDELFRPSDDVDLTRVTSADDTALTPSAWLGQWGQATDTLDLDLAGAAIHDTVDAADLLIADDSLGGLLDGFVYGRETGELAAIEISSVEEVLDRAGTLDVGGFTDLRLRLDSSLLDDGSGGLV